MSLTPHPPPPPSPSQYWCHHCNKRVPIETLPDHPDVICCFECKNGFVESIAVSVSVSSRASDEEEEEEDGPPFGGEFLHILRLIALAAREDDEPPPPPPDGRLEGGGSDYLRIELDGWSHGSGLSVDHVDHDHDHDVDDDVDDGEDAHDRNEGVEDDGSNNNDINDDNDDDGDGDVDENEDEMVRRRDVLRLQLRDFASRATSRRNRILDWAEILMGLEDESVEFRLRVSGGGGGGGGGDHGYVGDPGDYVDAAGYEALLNTLAENDGGGRRGAPPAAKVAVEGLRTVEVDSGETEVCAICKDGVFNNEGKVVKELECGHMYHGECIVAWLDSKNSCPVCRFELPTDDPEYEEDRKKRLEKVTAVTTDRGCSSTSRGAD